MFFSVKHVGWNQETGRNHSYPKLGTDTCRKVIHHPLQSFSLGVLQQQNTAHGFSGHFLIFPIVYSQYPSRCPEGK